MQSRRRFLGLVGALAIGLTILQPPGGAAAEEQKTTQQSASPRKLPGLHKVADVTLKRG